MKNMKNEELRMKNEELRVLRTAIIIRYSEFGVRN